MHIPIPTRLVLTRHNVFYAASRIAPIYPLYIRDGEGNIMTDQNGKMCDYGDGAVNGLVRSVVAKASTR